ncbi:unnamed protein product [Vicia faba]|uniref:Uncharacterized protein n=1 Tax=Vicia faba TaxID=3906 RepID=A0AAV0YAF6_VICFA|nr:unnamed protein product [Vicia faba]
MTLPSTFLSVHRLLRRPLGVLSSLPLSDSDTTVNKKAIADLHRIFNVLRQSLFQASLLRIELSIFVHEFKLYDSAPIRCCCQLQFALLRDFRLIVTHTSSQFQFDFDATKTMNQKMLDTTANRCLKMLDRKKMNTVDAMKMKRMQLLLIVAKLILTDQSSLQM